MVEAVTGKDRPKGISYNRLASGDAGPLASAYLEESPMEPGVTKVDVRRFSPKKSTTLKSSDLRAA
jgi:hypothetical protein|tara:strand:- start:2170 stop:2367 length:198 start_codon:yes stop_codon:yes gene_type:complete